MGVRGLSTLMRNAELGKSIRIEDCAIVIDCWALVHYLYNQNELDHCFGGQSYFFYKAVEDFLAEMLKYNVKITVICDGYSDFEIKGKTKIFRMNQLLNHRIATQPIKFSLESYYCQILAEVCKKLEIACVVVKGEADRDIAILANSLNAYVLSNDSDYCIYNTNPGLINLASLRKEISGPYSGVVVSYRDLAAHLDLDVEKLPLLALLCGNDYFQTHYIGKRFPLNTFSGSDRILNIVKYIKKFSTVRDLVDDFKKYLSKDALIILNRYLHNILFSYKIEEKYEGMLYQEIINQTKLLITGLKDKIGVKFWESETTKHEWLTKLFNQCELCILYYSAANYGYHFLTIPPQNYNFSSAHESTKKIRKCIYKIIYCRNEETFSIKEFDRCQNIYKESATVEISKINDLELKLVKDNSLIYLLNELSVSRPPANLSDLAQNLNVKKIDLVLISLKFIMVNKKISYTLDSLRIILLGLLRSFFLNQNSQKMLFDEFSDIKNHESNIYHLIGEYIATFGCVHTLNLLLGQPFQVIPRMYWWDGPLIVDSFINILKEPSFLEMQLNIFGVSIDMFNEAIYWIYAG